MALRRVSRVVLSAVTRRSPSSLHPPASLVSESVSSLTAASSSAASSAGAFAPAAASGIWAALQHNSSGAGFFVPSCLPAAPVSVDMPSVSTPALLRLSQRVGSSSVSSATQLVSSLDSSLLDAQASQLYPLSYETSSVLKKRKKKMNKHKHRKLRKRTRFERRNK